MGGSSLEEARFRDIKSEIRIVGIDDGPFKPHSEKNVLVVGAVFRGGLWLDGILSTHVEVDGIDATEKIAKMINRSKHKDQLRVIMTSGITFAGFNVVDVHKLFKETALPVIVVSRKYPDLASVKRALKNLSNWQQRWKSITSAGEIYTVRPLRGEASIYIQIAGIGLSDAKRVVRSTATRSFVPEPLRAAHLIATGIVHGESTGRV